MSTTLPLLIPQPPSSIAIFLNGQRELTDEQLFIKRKYQHIIVCDGAWNSVKNLLPQLINTAVTNVIVLGDGDSIDDKPKNFIQINSQDTTDFEKALNHVVSMNNKTANLSVSNIAVSDIDVFWGNGGALDHTLGNLAIASNVYHQQNIVCHFYTDSQYYRYIDGSFTMQTADTIITENNVSLFPFPHCEIISTQGLKYPMYNYVMSVHTQQSLRNQIIHTNVCVEAVGSYYVFIGLV